MDMGIGMGMGLGMGIHTYWQRTLSYYTIDSPQQIAAPAHRNLDYTPKIRHSEMDQTLIQRTEAERKTLQQ